MQMDVESAKSLITLLSRTQFRKSYSVQNGVIYERIRVLSEDALIAVQCQWDNDILFNKMYIIGVRNGIPLGATRFELEC